jgi:hypothetical protein
LDHAFDAIIFAGSTDPHAQLDLQVVGLGRSGWLFEVFVVVRMVVPMVMSIHDSFEFERSSSKRTHPPHQQ